MNLKKVTSNKPVIIAAAAAALLLLYAGLRLVLASRTLAAEWKLGLIFSIALLFLLGGLAGMDMALRRVLRPARREISLPLVFCLAYLLPGLVFLAPALGRVPLVSFPGDSFAWYFIWQALVMGAYQLNRLRRAVAANPWQKMRLRLPAALLSGGMSGLGLWLAGVFVISVFTAQLPEAVTFPITRLMKVVMLLAALGVAPWAEEMFFRRQLLQQGQPRLGAMGASGLSALIFAVLQARPLLAVPAFLFGLGAAALAQRTRSALAPAAAHFVFNLLMLILGWNGVI
jgi:membrane protease YdiL (CAAX protease family)